MIRSFAYLAAGALGLALSAPTADAMPLKAQAPVAGLDGVTEAGSRKYRRRSRPQVRSFRQRRGGYSYAPQDTINTYGDNRSLFGGSNVYRDPQLDSQTRAGPFDHGFFFESGNAPNGGNAPYFN
ncbi:MAG: hypothetical protein AAGJ53_03065 [Pseudomonadota bacterium]